jgi:PIN domain nuclease of toxin-antitoxin system
MIVLDTHIWLWWINGSPGKLPAYLIERIENDEEVFVSAISCFEIEWLSRHGRIELDVDLDDWFSATFLEAGVACLPVTADIARLAASLPEHNKDPQDRIIIATSVIHNANLISADRQFSLYDEISHLLIQS